MFCQRLERLILQFILINHRNPLKKRNINKNLRWLLYSQVKPSHRNVILPNYFLFDKFPGIIQNGKNFIIIVASKKIYGISTILVLKFWYFGFVGLFSCFVEEL